MGDCVFCRIASGEFGCWKVYEDDSVISFLDINPVTEGHTLVIPKTHAGNIMEMGEADISALAAALRKIAPVVAAAVDASGFNILNNCGAVAGQAVEHVHFHIIPRKSGDGRGYRWVTFAYEEGRGEELSRRIAGRLPD